MTDVAPSPELDPSTVELLRRDAFEELGRVAMLAEDYALKLFDATEQRNLMATAGRLQQLRFCTMNMIQTFNLFLRKPHGQGVAEADGPATHRQDQRPGDGVA
jgi:hypothetical protein